MDIDPRDELLGIDPPMKWYAELERLNLGRFAYGMQTRWRWNESEVRRMSTEVAQRVRKLLKEGVA
jgi:hypothetical protein